MTTPGETRATSNGPRPIVLVGPTAGGKSDLAVALAEALGGEVIGADSMQVYRGLDAGTAKPEPALRARAPHHLIDIVDPTERFTVADWLARTERAIADIAGRGRVPIVVGGTNLYLKALLEGLFDGPSMDADLRAKLEQLDNAALHAKLAAVDPAAAQRIHLNDRKKMVRAIEVFELTGSPISQRQTQWSEGGSTGDDPGSDAGPVAYRHNPILIGLDWPVEAINRRINARVKAMFFPTPGVESLPDETRRLRDAGLLGEQARQALGYKQVLEYLEHPTPGGLDEAFEKTKVLTRRFAKTQRTWLKRYRGVAWIPASRMTPGEIVDEALRVVRG